MKTILLIDDCENYREITAHLLSDLGHDVWQACNPMDALPMLQDNSFDLIVCDLHMPFTSGEEQENFVYSYEVGVKTIQELRQLYPAASIIALSNTPAYELKRISGFLDPIPAYSKPVHCPDVLAIIDSHLGVSAQSVVQ